MGDGVGDEWVDGSVAARHDRHALREWLVVHAATIDELLSTRFEALPGRKADTDAAARRLAAWCRSSASGDWAQFESRLARDGWDFASVLARFANARHTRSLPLPARVADAMWSRASLCGSPGRATTTGSPEPEPTPPSQFDALLLPLVDEAQARLWSTTDAAATAILSDSARAGIRRSLLQQLSDLCAPALYALFDSVRELAAPDDAHAQPRPDSGVALYQRFVAEMKAAGLSRLLEAKPGLWRLIATITRQWIDTTRELIERLAADLPSIRAGLLAGAPETKVAGIDGGLSDPHNGGRSVRIVVFENGARVVYKPKDLRVDAALHALVGRLNRAAPPLALRAVRTIGREGYGWCEFIEHASCADEEGLELYFRRAAAWLALLHCLAATDMHHENFIAHGDYPMPLDIETILQASTQDPDDRDREGRAHQAACNLIADSVMAVGLIPSYRSFGVNGRSAVGGLIANDNTTPTIRWGHVNTDAMRPKKAARPATSMPNLPHVNGHYAKFSDYVDAFIAGFVAYAKFLVRQGADAGAGGLFQEFAGLPVRRVWRPTTFYTMVLQQLTDHRTMHDGVAWSAQADFVARLADWNQDSDPHWPLLQAERSALLSLNVPYFFMASDGVEAHDFAGVSFRCAGMSGLERASARVQDLDDRQIDWQVTVIRHNTETYAGQARSPGTAGPAPQPPQPDGGAWRPAEADFFAEADRIAGELALHAIRRDAGAAWIGLDWSGDSDAAQLVCLGAGLYNGVSGIGLFLAAHAAGSGCQRSAELARAGVAHVCTELTGRNAPRVARSLGISGGSGLGSIAYALAVMAKCLEDDELLAHAHRAALLVTDDLIETDRQLDVVGGSAGAILGLLRVYRDTGSGDVLARAIRCGEHLLRQPRVGPHGRRTWHRQVPGSCDLNGMAHGAAGYAYALGSLATATGHEEFAQYAAECLAFENASYDRQRGGWPALDVDGGKGWPAQWYHGAPGIGLGRIGLARRGWAQPLSADIVNAVTSVRQGWAEQQLDTLCCGALGSIELLSEAATTLDQPDLQGLAARCLSDIVSAATQRGDYRWDSGDQAFNPGLFRGIAGIGYTALRRINRPLPNVLLWE